MCHLRVIQGLEGLPTTICNPFIVFIKQIPHKSHLHVRCKFVKERPELIFSDIAISTQINVFICSFQNELVKLWVDICFEVNLGFAAFSSTEWDEGHAPETQINIMMNVDKNRHPETESRAIKTYQSWEQSKK